MTRNHEAQPVDYPTKREWALSAVVELSDFPALDESWSRSRQILAEMHQHLTAAQLSTHVRTIAVSGSLGRMEASDQSDCDLIVVLDDQISPAEPAAAQLCDSVWIALEAMRLKPPRSGGIYALPTSLAALCSEESRGRVDEDIPTFGKRFQLLWDAQPVYGYSAYEQLLDSVIDWYTAASPGEAPLPWWRYLLNDLLRYYRSLCVKSQWDTNDGLGQWRSRNLKLGYSRVVMYAALLCLLGEGSRLTRDPNSWLRANLRLTPLERLAWCYRLADETGFDQVAATYDSFLAQMADPEFRRQLTSDSSAANHSTDYLTCREGSRELALELSRLIRKRQDAWDASFGASLLF